MIDTHCHLDDLRLYEQRAGIIAAAAAGGVDGFIVPGVDPVNWERILSLAATERRIFAAPGVHPLHADKWSAETAAALRNLAPEIVAVGEIGLDYTPGMPPNELQQEVFKEQLQIACEASLPVIIHCRRAFADTLEILARFDIKRIGGVMHAFSGSAEVARHCIALGLRIGVAGSITWLNAVKPLKVLQDTALEHILLETDSPDLSPEPYRGMLNSPANLVKIAQKVAAIKGLPIAAVAAAVDLNTRTAFPKIFPH